MCFQSPPPRPNDFRFIHLLLFLDMPLWNRSLSSGFMCPTTFWKCFPICPMGSSSLTSPKFDSFSFLSDLRFSPYEISGPEPLVRAAQESFLGASIPHPPHTPKTLESTVPAHFLLHLFQLQTLFFVCNHAKTLYLPPFCPCSVFL